jgi:hypothetical protein
MDLLQFIKLKFHLNTVFILFWSVLISCAPIEDSKVEPEIKPPYYPFAVNGMLVEKVVASGNSNFDFVYSYDTTARLTQIVLSSLITNPSKPNIRFSYLGNTNKPKEIIFARLPNSLWPYWNSKAGFDYDRSGRLTAISIYDDTTNLATRKLIEAKYFYKNNLLLTTKYYQNNKLTDSIVHQEWDKNLSIRAESFGKDRSLLLYSVIYDADSIPDRRTMLHQTAGQITTYEISKKQKNQNNLLNNADANPLWILSYLYFLQDLRFPPPSLNAKLDNIYAIECKALGCYGIVGANSLITNQFSLSNIANLEPTLLPQKVRYSYKDNCRQTIVSDFSATVSYQMAK